MWTLRLVQQTCMWQRVFMYQPTRFKYVGASHSVTKKISANDVKLFAEYSDDYNPIHLDKQFAKSTKYGKCIVHGLLTNGLISGALAGLPGAAGAIFLKQEIKFTSPVYVDDTVEASAEITEIKKRMAVCKLKCTVVDRKETVIEGWANVLLAKEEESS